MTAPLPAPSAPSLPEAAAVPRRCPACGEEVRGHFCQGCGQSHADVRVPFRHWLRDYAEDLTHLDSRLWATLWTLVRRPGELTRAYVEGRRSTYWRPFRLYLTASAAFFLALAVQPEGTSLLQVNRQPESAPVLAVPAGTTKALLETVESPQEEAPRLDGDTEFERRANRFMERRPEEAQAVMNRTLGNDLPKALLVLVPVFAALLTLLYRRQKRFYAEHFLFGLHVHAFTFLVMAAAVLVPWEPVRALLRMTVPLYLVLALRRVYGQGWVRTTLKGALLGGAYLVVLLLAVVGVAFHAIWTAP